MGGTITVIGAGAWGTALAATLCRSNDGCFLYSRNEALTESMNRLHTNERYLPYIGLPLTLKATACLEEAVTGSKVVVVTTPSQFIREFCSKLAALPLKKETALVLCSKGIERESLKLMSEIVGEILPDNPVAILSGPNFADEVAMGLPAATVIACKDRRLGDSLVQLFGTTAFRPYYSQDVVGTQIGGAAKNVLAIACGIVAGKGLGENARAALITRGLAEMMRLGEAKGGKRETLMGLSGMGDLILTCSSSKSRNMSFGIALGEGKTMEEISSTRQSVTEGVTSAQSVVQLAEALNVEMPICAAVYNILHHGLDIDTATKGLLQRPFTYEG